MNVQLLVQTREKINTIINELKKLNIDPTDLAIINKTWYPVLFKFFYEEINDNDKQYFKDFLPKINIPFQRGRESTKRETQNRYESIKKDWLNYLTQITKSSNS